MKPVYLSHFINVSTPLYGGVSGKIKINQDSSIAHGDTANTLHLSLPNHVGTHIDFPYHFHRNGKKLNDYPASFWIFENVGFIQCSLDDVENQLGDIDSDIELLILKTGFGSCRGKENYWSSQPIIPSHFARLFRDKFPKLRVFGFDMISMTSKKDRAEGKNAHLQFLIEQNILILEDMDLSNFGCKPDKVIVSPLPIEGADGSPCSVIAF